MFRLLCPFFWLEFWLNADKATRLFIRHDATLLRVETELQHSHQDAHGDATNAATLLLEKGPNG